MNINCQPNHRKVTEGGLTICYHCAVEAEKARILSQIKGIGCEEGIDQVTIAKVLNGLR